MKNITNLRWIVGIAVLIITLLLCACSQPHNADTYSLDIENARLEYACGEVLDTAGVRLFYTEANGNTIELGTEVEAPDMSTAGQKEVWVRCDDIAFSYLVNVEPCIGLEAEAVQLPLGEALNKESLKLLLRCANGVTVPANAANATLDASAVDTSNAGNYAAKVSYTIGNVTYTANVAITVFGDAQALLESTRTQVCANLEKSYSSYDKKNYTEAYYQKLTDMYQASIQKAGSATDVITLHALLSDTIATMDSVLTLELMERALELQREQMIAKLEAQKQPELYTQANYNTLCEAVSACIERLNGVSVTEDYDTATNTLKATYGETISRLEKINKKMEMLTPYANDLQAGGWYVSGGGAAELSNNMPEGITGVSAKLSDQNTNVRFISAAYMLRNTQNSTKLLSATDGSVSLGFWVYISDIEALGEKTGFFICLSSSNTPNSGEAAGRYNVGNAPRYITEENGFVSGWNYVEIPSTAFDGRDSRFWQDYVQISFALRTLGDKSSEPGRTYYPAEWKEGTEVLVTGFRLVFETSHPNYINAVSVQPNN
ncbi:MAG: hypothetical protein IKD06_04590 [Clostridia bacterium]|nr:hypothetical protein [Clostridia bacterium]